MFGFLCLLFFFSNMIVLIPSMKNTVDILFLELWKIRMINTIVENVADNKMFSSLPRPAEEQPAKKNKISTQDPFTRASRESQEQGSLMHTRRLLRGTMLQLLKRSVL